MTEPGTGLAKTAAGTVLPPQFTQAYKRMASRRLAAGPAPTMATRINKGLVSNAMCCSLWSTGASRRSSILT